MIGNGAEQVLTAKTRRRKGVSTDCADIHGFMRLLVFATRERKIIFPLRSKAGLRGQNLIRTSNVLNIFLSDALDPINSRRRQGYGGTRDLF